VTYYCYRYYNPQLGRWISRDPIGERGSAVVENGDDFDLILDAELLQPPNLFVFVGNNSNDQADRDGRALLCGGIWAVSAANGTDASTLCASRAIKKAKKKVIKDKVYGDDVGNNGYNALHCLANCYVAKCSGNKDDYGRMLAANAVYEACTKKNEHCKGRCGNDKDYKDDVISDYKADAKGLCYGFKGLDCIDACRAELKTPGPKPPKKPCTKTEIKCCEKRYDGDGPGFNVGDIYKDVFPAGSRTFEAQCN
jgi:RHS repeat-associated protein